MESLLVEQDGDFALHWRCARPGCSASTRLAGTYCRACGTKRSEPVHGQTHFHGFTRRRVLHVEDQLEGSLRLGERERAFRIECVDDVAVVRTSLRDLVVPLANFERSRPSTRTLVDRPQGRSALDSLRARWNAPIVSNQRLTVGDGSSTISLSRLELARLGLEETEPARAQAERVDGDVVMLFDAGGASPCAVVERRGRLEVHWGGRTIGVIDIAPGLSWLGTATAVGARVSGVALGVELDPSLPDRLVLRQVVSLEGEVGRLQLRALADPGDRHTPVLVADRAVLYERNELFASGAIGQGDSPSVLQLAVGSALSATPLADAQGFALRTAASFGSVQYGPYEAIGVASEGYLAWVDRGATARGTWRPPADWDVRSAAFAFDGAAAAGLMATRSGSMLVAADITQGPLRCVARSTRIGGSAQEVHAAALRNDVLWVAVVEHGHLTLKWYYLPSFKGLYDG